MRISALAGKPKRAGAESAKPAKTLHRMLSKASNPTMDNLAATLGVVGKKLGVEMRAHGVDAA
ncbi:MAG: hypothetical protein ACLQME_05785 [Alphaproteobacteria bacterium]